MTSDIFDEIEPFNTGWLQVGECCEHSIYFEESGNPNGRPALFLHGGPGTGSAPLWRRYFDPQKYRIILFDQRGCGKSRPYASLSNNTTKDLIADIEQLRKHFDIGRWLIVGGSWGSTLAIAYAQTYPEKVSGMVLYGIFLGSREEIDWFYQNGANYILADAWEDFVSLIRNDERQNMIESYYGLLNSPDPAIQTAAAREWSLWEGRALRLVPDQEQIASFVEPEKAIAQAKIECHYFRSLCFLPNGQLIANASKIANIACVIIHGRYDLICPFKAAWTLHKSLPQSKLKIVPAAGHSAREPGIRDEIIKATNGFSDSGFENEL